MSVCDCCAGVGLGPSARSRIALFARDPVIAAGLPAKALREDWLQLVCSYRPKQSRKVWVRLTADAISFWETRPAFSADMLDARQKRAGHMPLDIVLLSAVASLLGRREGSDHMRLIDLSGYWWELRSDPPELIEEWVKAVSARLQHFRRAARQSQRFSQSTVIKERLKEAYSKRSSLRRVLLRLQHRLPLVMPCCGPSGETAFSLRVSQRCDPYRGDVEGHNDLVDKARFEEVSDPDLQEAQAAHWSDQAVRYLRNCKRIPDELFLDFSLTLRFGVPDGLKRLIWPLAAGSALDDPAGQTDAGRFYANLTARAFGSAVPVKFEDPVPTFCQGIQGKDEAPPLSQVVQHLWLLTPQGEAALRRLLWLTQLTSHVEFCPFLPNLFATLLPFFSEAEAMLIVNHIITEAEADPNPEKKDNPKIILSRQLINKQAKLFVREGKKRRNTPEAMAHLEQLGIDIHAEAAHLLEDGMAHALPFRAFCRVVGSFLVEGSEAILRYALALVKLRTPTILEWRTAEEAREKLRSIGKALGDGPEAVDGLTKAAYSIVLRDVNMGRVSSFWGSSYVAPKLDYRPHLFCRPRLFEPKGSCPDELWEALWSWVPPTCRIFDPRLVYLPSMHGTSIRTCLEMCKKHKGCPMIFFLYTQQGDIIGGFAPVIWVRTHGYLKLTDINRSAEDAFVFRRLHGGCPVEVFPWSGFNEMMFQASEMEGLIFGGDGAAISIYPNLAMANTGESESFSSPVLIPQEEPCGAFSTHEDEAGRSSTKKTVGTDFELLRLEIFALF